ncbi:MAG: pilus assembly protein TadG-related protein [Anaerolineales bacterium]
MLLLQWRRRWSARVLDPAGQTSVIMLMLVVLFLGIAGFSVDGMRVFLDRRGAQNAADSAALAGALAICGGADPVAPAIARAADNGFVDTSLNQGVQVSWPPLDGLFAGDPEYVEVAVRVQTEGALVRLFYDGALESTARAIGHCNFHRLGSNAALFGGARSCQNTIDWSGSNTVVNGNVHSNNDLHLSGQSSLIKGQVTYVTSVDAVPGKVTYEPAPPANPRQVLSQPYPVDFELESFSPGGVHASAAEQAGEYAQCDCRMNLGWLEDHGYFDANSHRLSSGLYYSSGTIDLDANDLIADGVTLVAQGGITVSGSRHRLSPYQDGLLLFSGLTSGGGAACNRPAIRLSGSDNRWNGLMYAPGGAIQLSGASTSTLSGSLIGYTLSLNGASILIEFDSAYLPPPPPTVGLAE